MTNQQMRLLSLSILALGLSLMVCFVKKDIFDLLLTAALIAYAVEYSRSLKIDRMRAALQTASPLPEHNPPSPTTTKQAARPPSNTATAGDA